jgi:hypothetical protein
LKLELALTIERTGTEIGIEITGFKIGIGFNN